MSSNKSTEKTKQAAAQESSAKSSKKKVSRKKAVSKKSTATKSTATKSTATKSTAKSTQAPAVTASSGSTVQTVSEPAAAGSGLVRLALIASLLALLIAGYAAYQFTLSSGITEAKVTGLDDRLKFVVSEQQSLRGGFDGLNAQVNNDTKRIDTSLNSVQKSVADLQMAADASIDDIKANLGKSVARWKLDEIQSLLTRVNRSYQLTGNQEQAIAGLKLARASLASIDNPRLEAVSMALEEDVLRVEADRNVDIVSIYNRLANMSSMVNELALAEDARVGKGPEGELVQPQAGEPESAEDSGILDAGKALFDDIGSLVKHKNLDAPLQPSLDNQSRFVLYESLRLDFQAAMVAVLRRDNDAYQSHLVMASEMLTTYFDTEQAQFRTFSDQLQVMQSYDISLNASAVSHALDELNRVMVIEN